ncbi:TIGR02594, TIGR02594 family protein [uncultured Caudovirales phage]|uniref:TIGR02594, TIGR02594 family protein n=1 Tax=uncultured Caudovirales phage TaxID=2100421 RepID=A0A6J5MUT8_9CAUD|nr:TIGR02594, TIGR02594 family protein [uncultured Caudovirales phage]CAB4150975.1 TIGR02594, TIGR02594 family protein [uncultured Caudovirales phage]CAB4174766.1 TIGR02594, TIGR02594 family protein [uncultured Caudovirales phage]CAB4179880.1 TIGR02594, TIGR02594 family protein [uncultured Caudovirales phage]CAB4185547.1 TIGR02594, TIGR02594 family protein [uncultured Caudovirales phage]
MSQAQDVLAIAKKYVDEAYKEGTNNDTIFGKWYGMNNQPWCAMFVSFCFAEAGLSKLVAAQTKKGFAYCPAAVDWFKKRGQLVPVEEARAGDIIFFDFDGNKATAEHVEICYGAQHDKKQLTTFGGNTAPSGAGSQANGDGAYKKKRPYDKIIAVARPKWID